MRTMSGIIRRPSGVYYHLQNIPADLRAWYGNRAQIWKSLDTKDAGVANLRAGPIAKKYADEIANTRAAIRRGETPLGSDGTVTPEFLAMIQANTAAYYDRPEIVECWEEDGIPVFRDPDRAAAYYAKLSIDLEKSNVALSEAREVVQPVKATDDTLVISAALGAFVATQQTRPKKDLSELSSYVGWLIDVIGDKPLRSLTPSDFLFFEEWLPHFPTRLTKQQSAMSFRDIMGQIGKATPPRRSLKTVKKWFDFWHLFFDWCGKRHFMDINPVAGLAPKIARHGVARRPQYDGADIAAIFSTPMFHGCSKVHAKNGKPYGYREVPGPLLVKDSYYWLPLLAAYNGFRLEEAGGMPLADVACHKGIDVLDLSKRKLKTATSSRVVPLHPKMIALGFLDHVKALRVRGEEFLFPELPHDAEIATGGFSKWWGHWCNANALTPGEGFDNPEKVFHWR